MISRYKINALRLRQRDVDLRFDVCCGGDSWGIELARRRPGQRGSLPATTRSGNLSVICQVPWPPLECPITTTRASRGVPQEVQGRFSLLSSFSNASTQCHTSAVLGPCQSKPYHRVSYMDEVQNFVRTQDVLPDGIIVQLRPCRGNVSLQKGRSRISTPAPSNGNGHVSGLGSEQWR